jgi:threonine/homoserine/homoserine lactone efflux protein
VLVQAFSVNALNPKTALFCLALLPQFVSPSRGRAGLQILVLGAVFVALGFMTNTVYGGMAGTLGSFARGSLRFQKAARDAGGGTLIALGIAAAVTPALHRPMPATP